MRTTALPPAADDSPSPFTTGFEFEPAFAPVPRIGRTADLAAFSDDEVAALPTTRIAEMTRQELIAVIRGVRADHLRPELRERLPQMDGETLRRLVFLTRRLCRDRQELTSGPYRPAGLACGMSG